MKYVILRSTVDDDNELGPHKAGPAGRKPVGPAKIEIDELSANSAARLSRERGVHGVAPVLPMKLIEPMGSETEEMLLHDGAAWGIHAVAADTTPFDGEDVVVAVLDTGIDATHPAFQGVDIDEKNFTPDADHDEDGHGTHCAGTIFGQDVDGIRIGIAPGVKKALVGKVLGENGGESDKIVEAIQWAAAEGAHVISMSLGFDFPGYVNKLINDGKPSELATSIALEGYRTNLILFERLASFLEAFNRATLLVAAAGNESRREEDPDFEIAVSPPAVADGIMSVSALEQTPEGLVIAPFSNVGASISAPGVDILSAKRGGGLYQESGTSMATPHVAGVAALWAQRMLWANELSGNLLYSRVMGTATSSTIKSGYYPGDIGAGIVRAPQE